MISAQRREKIAKLLKQGAEPVPGGALAKEFGVTRQVIVGDIALLRASGMQIHATPNGYVFARPPAAARQGITRVIACNHAPQATREELYTVVDNGGGLIDVIVEHPIYGELTGPLDIFSRHDADEFLKRVKERSAPLLSKLTDGIHLHTIACRDEAAFERIAAALDGAGILLKD
ncbi:MAG: transcription repressor NadR [Christensenellales bacterium]|jgi:transcriptional regulator of NAD metabolism